MIGNGWLSDAELYSILGEEGSYEIKDPKYCWHTWKEVPLFTSVEVRCTKCGKLKEKDDEDAEAANKG